MPDYQKMYLTLFNEMSTSISAISAELQRLQIEVERLKSAQQAAEEVYIRAEDCRGSEP